MKKTLSALLCLAMLCGCASKGTATAIDYRTQYQSVLDKVYDSIYEGIDYSNTDEELIGIIEPCAYVSVRQALENIGYALRDLNGDEVPELLIGETKGFNGFGNYIYSIYRLNEGKAEFVTSNWYRNSMQILSNGNAFMSGSGGAASFYYGEYRFDDYAQPVIVDGFFSDYDFDKPDNLKLYHTKNALWDTYSAEEFDGDMDEFFAIANRYSEDTIELEMTPLMEIREYVSKTVPYPTDKEIDIFFADKLADTYELTLDFFEGTNDVIITTDDAIENVVVYRLTFKDIVSDNVVFDKEAVTFFNAIDSEKPLMLTLFVSESLPTTAISYTGKDGAEHCYFIAISGEDGSPLLVELGPENFAD